MASKEQSAIAIEACGRAGSGVIVDEHHVVTALHVVIGCGEYQIAHSDGTTSGSLELASVTDIARIETADPLPFAERVRVRRAIPGEACCFIASVPRRVISCGTVESVSDGRNGLIHTAVTERGNSGAPLYGSDGAMLGVVVTKKLDVGGGASSVADMPWMINQ